MIKKLFQNFVTTILLFQYLYRVPWSFLPFNISNIISLISVLYVIKNYSVLKSLGVSTIYRKLIFVAFLLVLYTVILHVAAGGSLKFVVTTILLILNGVMFPGALIIYLVKNRGGGAFDTLLICIIMAGVLQGVCACLCVVNPGIKSYIHNVLLRMEDYKSFIEAHLAYRGNGMGQGYLFVLPVIQSYIILLAIYYIVDCKKYILIFAVPVMACSVVFNARTGIVFCLISLIPYVLISVLKIRKLVFSLLVVLITGFIGFYFLKDTLWAAENSKWVMEVFPEWMVLENLKSDGGQKTLTTLKYMFHLPPAKNFIFGKALDVSGTSIQAIPWSSDVGYTIQLYAGGLVYLGLLMYLYLYPFVCVCKVCVNRSLKAIILGSVIGVIIVNYKGDLLSKYPFYIVYVSTTLCIIACSNISRFENDLNNMYAKYDPFSK
jgi:hypothetical protein